MSYKRAGLVAGGLKQAPEMKPTGIGPQSLIFQILKTMLRIGGVALPLPQKQHVSEPTHI